MLCYELHLMPVSRRCSPAVLHLSLCGRAMRLQLCVCGLWLCSDVQEEQLAAAALAADGCNVILASSGGKLSHLRLSSVRQSGRAAGCIKVRVPQGGQQQQQYHHSSSTSTPALSPNIARLDRTSRGLAGQSGWSNSSMLLGQPSLLHGNASDFVYLILLCTIVGFAPVPVLQ